MLTNDFQFFLMANHTFSETTVVLIRCTQMGTTTRARAPLRRRSLPARRESRPRRPYKSSGLLSVGRPRRRVTRGIGRGRGRTRNPCTMDNEISAGSVCVHVLHALWSRSVIHMHNCVDVLRLA